MQDYIDIQRAKSAIYDLKELCQFIIMASLLWSGEDEKKNIELKRIRTLAGVYLEMYK